MGNEIDPCYAWGTLTVLNQDEKPLKVFTLHLEVAYEEKDGTVNTIFKKDYIHEKLDAGESMIEKYKIDIQCHSKLEKYSMIATLEDQTGKIIAECGDECKHPYVR